MTMKAWPRAAIDLMLKQHNEMLECIKLARECIALDSQCLAECHTDPKSGQLDEVGTAGVAEYSALLARIDSAIAKASGKAESKTDWSAA